MKINGKPYFTWVKFRKSCPTSLKYGVLLLLAFSLCINASAQTQTNGTSTSASHSKPKKKTTAKTAAPARDITVTIKSLCERPVPIYAGPRVGLKKPKIQTLGGMSTNTLHVKSNDVVCIMSSDGKKTMACVNLKTTTTALEVNSSGSDIKGK